MKTEDRNSAHGLRILSLEDFDLDAEMIVRALRRGGIEFVWHRVQTRHDFERGIAEFRPGIILADYKLPSFDGAQALAMARERCPDVPVIIVSGAVGEEIAVELIKNGAADFVLKDWLARLVPAVHRALQEIAERKARLQAEAELRALNEQLEQRVTERTHELSQKNAHMEEDLRMARELQMALLPNVFPTLPRGVPQAASAVRFCSLFRPTNSMSGDFFNVVRVSDTAVGVFICDVMGHGVRAALVTSMMRALEEQLREEAADPGALMTEINRALRGILGPSCTALFATACFVVVDVATSRISFASAGHPSPLLVRSARRSVEPIIAPSTVGPALGLFDSVQYVTCERPVASEDLILFFTDGLFEVENPHDEAFSEARLRESVRQRAGLPPVQLLNDVFAEVERFAEGRDFVDDVCVVGMEIAHVDAGQA